MRRSRFGLVVPRVMLPMGLPFRRIRPGPVGRVNCWGTTNKDKGPVRQPRPRLAPPWATSRTALTRTTPLVLGWERTEHAELLREDPAIMKHTTLGGLEVSRLGLGCMGMSAFYTGANTDDAKSVRTIQRALELGITFFDTAEIYGPYKNEELLGRALGVRRDEVVVATKFGTILHTKDGSRGLDGSPANVRLSVEGSLRRLG